MIVKSVTLFVKPQNIKEFIEATLENQNNSRKEKGIECFDFLQCKDDPNKFLLYEGYKSKEAMEEHRNTKHYKKWIDTVEEYFSKPRERDTFISVTLEE